MIRRLLVGGIWDPPEWVTVVEDAPGCLKVRHDDGRVTEIRPGSPWRLLGAEEAQSWTELREATFDRLAVLSAMGQRAAEVQRRTKACEMLSARTKVISVERLRAALASLESVLALLEEAKDV